MNGYSLVNIEEGKDYTPVAKGMLVLGGSITPTVAALHCTNTNTSCVFLQALGDEHTTQFPPHSFTQGHVYPIFLAKITQLGGANFVGYQQTN